MADAQPRQPNPLTKIFPEEIEPLVPRWPPGVLIRDIAIYGPEDDDHGWHKVEAWVKRTED